MKEDRITTPLKGNNTSHIVIVRCACGKESKAERKVKYKDVGEVPESAVLGTISNCPSCSSLYGYTSLKWHDSAGNEL